MKTVPSNDPPYWKTKFDALPNDLKNALEFLAIYSAPIRKIRIQECCGCLNVTPERVAGRLLYPQHIVNKNSWNQIKINSVVDQLQKQGWIDVTTEGFLRCKKGLREPIVYHLYVTGQYQRYADVLFTLTGGRYFMASYSSGKSWDRPKFPEDIVRELRHLFILNDTGPIADIFQYLEQYDRGRATLQELLGLFNDPKVHWLHEAKIESRNLLLQYILVRSLADLDDTFKDSWDLLAETGRDPLCDPVTQVLILDYALCAGKLDDPDLVRFSSTMAIALCHAHRAFVGVLVHGCPDREK